MWRAIGGWAAITPEERQLLVIEFRQRNRLWQAAGGKGKKPDPPQEPKGWLIEQQEQQQAQQRWEDKALEWKRRNESRYAEMERRAVAARAVSTTE